MSRAMTSPLTETYHYVLWPENTGEAEKRDRSSLTRSGHFYSAFTGIEAVIVVSSLLMLLCVALIGTVSIRDKAGRAGDEIR